MRKPLIAGNWKMNTTIKEGENIATDLKHIEPNEIDVVICPPFTQLIPLIETLSTTNIAIAAQNVSCYDNGAHTGEISAKMLSEISCKYILVGHSERRTNQKESNKDIHNKIQQALVHNLTPILCVGETLKEREENITFSVIENQIIEAINAIDFSVKELVIAYEPVWAIGTGKVATPDQAEDVHYFIRKLLKSSWNHDVSKKTRIIYGGSVNPSNAQDLFKQPNIDGALVGGASLKSNSFIEIINNYKLK